MYSLPMIRSKFNSFPSFVLLILWLVINPYFCLESSLKITKNSLAKQLFCNQNHFDMISYLGDHRFRFLVINYHYQHMNSNSKNRQFNLDQFTLHFDGNRFRYEYAKILNHNNLIQRGGFFIDQLNIYISFYRNTVDGNQYLCCRSIDDPNNHDHDSLFDCKDLLKSNQCQQQSIKTADSNHQTDICIELNESKCLKSSQNLFLCRIFPCDYSEYFGQWKRYRRISFVYDKTKEKIYYLFTNQTNPFTLNTIRLLSSTSTSNQSYKPLWFLKSINQSNKNRNYYRFYGAFQWQSSSSSSTTTNDNKIYFMIELLNYGKNNSDNNSTPATAATKSKSKSALIELIDGQKFLLSKNTKSWQTFFGCNRFEDYFYNGNHLPSTLPMNKDNDHEQHSNQTKLEHVNLLKIYLLTILIILLSLISMILIINNYNLFKKLFKNCFIIKFLQRL